MADKENPSGIRSKAEPSIGVSQGEDDTLLRGLMTASRPQRALLTIVFTDLENSTNLNLELGDERWAALREEHFQVGQGLIRQNEGWFIKYMGDAILAVFATASQGVRFAVDFHHDLRKLSAKVGKVLKVRIGLHAGEVDVRKGDVYGTEVNRASRVSTLGNGEQTFATEVVKNAMDALKPEWRYDVDFCDHGEVSLKGFAPAKEHVWEILDLSWLSVKWRSGVLR